MSIQGVRHSGVALLADNAESAADAAWVSAWAAAITALIAVIAAVVAAWQIHEARQARAQTRALATEVAQPYVVAYMQADDVSPEYAHFVVKNFGQTAALNVRISSSPELRRAIYDGNSSAQQRVQIRLPATIPILAPSQEWRTFWDNPAERSDKEKYPDRHDVTVHYTDSHNEPHTTNSILDFSTFDRIWFDRKTLHHLATATREINTKLGKFQEDIHGGLSVFTRNGDAKDDRRRAEREQAVREAREGREAARRRSVADDQSP